MTPGRLQELGLQRLDLLCGFVHHVLGENSLEHAYVLTKGLRSVANSPALAGHGLALEGLRRCCFGLSTEAALRSAAARYNDQQHISPQGQGHLFRIDERTLRFKPHFDIPSDNLRIALEELKRPTSPRPHGLTPADPKRLLQLRVSFDAEDKRYDIKGLPPELPPLRQHGRSARRPQEELQVSWADLLDQARDMDRLDRERRVERPGNWERRLSACELVAPLNDGRLEQRDSIDLKGLKHLIGLPGAGKTTLLVCLLRLLATRNLRVVVFFPSIEVCRHYLQDLASYGVAAGLLVGQGRETRRAHATKFAEAIASGDSLRGFGRTVGSAALFEGVCPLPAMTSAPAEAFNIGDRFCRDVLQAAEGKHRPKAHLCPVWSVCSYNTAARGLVDAQIWLGHVRSADTPVPVHTTAFNERYFEMIAAEFDVVIFDEADKAQQDLDMSGVSQLQLSGHEQSFHRQVQRGTLDKLASGFNAAVRNPDFAQVAMDTAEFEKLNIALISAIHRLDKHRRNQLQGLLLTPLRLIGDWLSPRRSSGLNPEAEFKDTSFRAKDAICFLWDSAAVRAFQFRDEPTASAQLGDDWRRAAEALHLPHEELLEQFGALTATMRSWLNAISQQHRHAIEARIAQLLAAHSRQLDPADLLLIVQVLVAVTFTVLAYRRLAPRLAGLIDDGLLPPVQAERRCSDALLAATPENLLGSLSGVKYSLGQTGPNGSEDASDIRLQYVVFSGAPRSLLYHLHEWRRGEAVVGPAVLLTSATSFLPASPAHHVDVPPSYLLRRAGDRDTSRKSRYAFRPVRDKEDSAAIRFSGERSEAVRQRNLERMATVLLDGGPGNSIVSADSASFDVQRGVRRKSAFIVNSHDQCRRLKAHIDARLPAWRGRVVAVVDEIPGDSVSGFVTAGRAEALGDDPTWDVLIFAYGALGRGTNIVFSDGPRRLDATIGTLYFLTRPHPTPEDLSLLVSLGASKTQRANTDPIAGASLEAVLHDVNAKRRLLYKEVGRLLRHPLYARGLGPLFEPFTANMAVPLLQTIGRAMRNGCPVQCFFVDRAWAEQSSRDLADNATSSMLLQLRQILERGVSDEDPVKATLYRELYGPFLEPLRDLENVRTGDASEHDDEPEGSYGELPLMLFDESGSQEQE